MNIVEFEKMPLLKHEKETIRIEAFSDGIFCIAVTLLSIEIGVEVKDGETNKDLLHSLIDNGRYF